MAQSTALFDTSDDGSIFDTPEVGSVQVLQADNGGTITIPGDAWLLKADFSPQGFDLLLTGPDGSQILIRDFFNLDTPPDLITEAGGIIPADLAISLAGPSAPGQYALLQNGPFAELAQAAESIGRVEATDGLVEAIRIDGSKVSLAKGDDIFQGDTLVTAKGAAIGITFSDDTTFSLGEEGRMVIDEMVYDPGTQEGQFSANLVQGVFSFVSGQIAKTSPDGMTVTTPVATIGIRGTKVAGRAAQEGAENTISLLPETDAQGVQSVGQLSVTNQGGTVTLSSVGATVQMTSSFQAPPPPVVFSPQQIQQNFGSTLTMQATTVAAKATNDAVENAQEAEQAAAEAEQAGAEAEAAEAEAEAAAAEAQDAQNEADAALEEAETARAEAEAAGDEEAIAAAEAAEAEAQAAQEEAETKAAEAEAQIAEAEAQVAEAEAAEAEAQAAEAEAQVAQAEAEHAANEMQAQSEAFAQFGGGPPPGAEGDAPPDGEGPPDGEPQAGDGDAPPDGEQQADGGEGGEGEGEGPEAVGPEGDDDAITAAAEEAARQAIAEGASAEEVFEAAADAAAAQLAAEGDSPEDIAEERAVAEQAFNDALAAGASPEEAMALAMQATEDQFGGDDGFDDGGPGPGGPGPGDDPNAQDGFGGDPNAPDGGGTFDGGGTNDSSGTNDGGGFNDGGGDFFGGGGDFFGGGGDFFGGGGDFYDGGGFYDDGGGGFYGDTLYGGGGGDYFGDPYGDPFGGDVFDPLLGEFFDLGQTFDIIHDDNQEQQQVVTQTDFAEFFTGTSSIDNFAGTSLNTNFYFAKAALGSDDVITDAGGSNQMAFDGLDSTVLKFTINGSDATKGNVEVWTASGTTYNLDTSYGGDVGDPGGTASTIDFTNVSQYLFADDDVPSLQGDYSAQTEVDPSAATEADDQGDIIVMPSLDVGDVGYVVAGGSGNDVFTLNDITSGTGGMDGIIVFGKGGGDTFNIAASFDGLLIGGITNTDNQDDGTGGKPSGDGIPDDGINTFSYSAMFTGQGTTGVSATIAGYTSTYWNGSSNVTETETSAVVNNSATSLNNMIWDIGHFIGSKGDDEINFNSGSLNTLEGGTGDDNIVLGSTAKLYTLTGGANTDSLTLNTSGAYTFAAVTMTTIETIIFNSGGNTVTVDTADMADVTTLTGNSGTDLLQLSDASTALDLTIGSKAITGAVGIQLGTGGDNLTVAAAQLDSATELTVITGGSGTDILTLGASGAFTLANTAVTDIETIVFNSSGNTLTVDTNDMVDITTITGSASTDILQLADSSTTLDLTSDMKTFTASVEIQLGSGGDNLTVAASQLDSSSEITAITGGANTDTLTLGETGTYSLANTTLSAVETIVFHSSGNSLTVDGADMTDVNTVTGSAGTDTLILSTAAGSGITVSNVDNITTASGADGLTITGAANVTITESAGVGDTYALNGTGNHTIQYADASTLAGTFETITGWDSSTDALAFEASSYIGDAAGLFDGGGVLLSAGSFASGSGLTTSNGAAVFFFQDTDTGIVRYDADGSDAAVATVLEIADLDATITSADITGYV
ncbi:MAG: hypothetical protein HOL66_05420 [Rhodospirillaceae bacterium]|jgi:hypothetical protein|nr:hypothetical protein [Rhodospirillaceae bacterium]MBT5561958.1 hypothetical protein [Rhodospirillaceae bacterium]MBT6240419.1 hypothetical protein [Rhodospirillaceae bacterium]MBT7137390.1 hypothetical protein [Rhodospirillaceae bacterium]